ncbi:MAG TPA: endonuclease [Saprospiraceae bacterium]|mgnify:CR=1 FL=1|nr:endonuclease [Saprospiraceae bacterium]MCC6688270.1 endonuclease [Saprospiraceae bacterium]HMV24166.1 endonuclease [Saprospiraceae bacterium]HMW74926.1 endonuclease [Saprospiraceae bacterium]HMX82704.1 endonuclease [Saprospiraceae bacterium]
MKKTLILILTLTVALSASAQYKYQPVFPGKKGDVLLAELVNTYKPLTVLDYSTARDTLFFRVYREHDSLACVYSDMKLPLPDGVDPTTYVYLSGTPNGINTEHAYPQSKGAVGAAKSDMNILLPSRSAVNEARGNLPYGESPDNQTQKWFYKTAALTSKPLVNIDFYTELNASVFEPREAVKGDVARKIFYFYTMYKTEADAADKNFFNLQKNTLCQWHLYDPVDSLEWERNKIIAKYQNNRENPYVLDCTLPYRTFCPDYQPSCDTTVATKTLLTDGDVKIFPVPFRNNLQICTQTTLSSDIEVSVVDILGKIVFRQKSTKSDNCLLLDAPEITALAPGFYFIHILQNKAAGMNYIIKPVIKE